MHRDEKHKKVVTDDGKTSGKIWVLWRKNCIGFQKLRMW
jgi:hypothetical protein